MSLTYPQLLTELAENIGLEPASLLSQQEIRVGELSIFMQQSGMQEAPDVVLCSILGAVPAQRFEEILRTLMQANHLWVGTGGGTLGLSPAGDAVTWCVRWPMRDLDGVILAALIAGFAELGRAWGQYLAADRVDSAHMPAQALMRARA